MAKAKKKEEFHIQAYGAFDDRMNLLYATVKPTKEAASEALARFNPSVSGHHYPYKVLPIRLSVDLGYQHGFTFEKDEAE